MRLCIVFYFGWLVVLLVVFSSFGLLLECLLAWPAGLLARVLFFLAFLLSLVYFCCLLTRIAFILPRSLSLFLWSLLGVVFLLFLYVVISVLCWHFFFPAVLFFVSAVVLFVFRRHYRLEGRSKFVALSFSSLSIGQNGGREDSVPVCFSSFSRKQNKRGLTIQ